MLKRFFSVCLLLSVLSSLLFSEEKYFATETQIQELEEIFQMQKAKLEEQKNLIGLQKKSIQNLQKHLSEAQESLKKSEADRERVEGRLRTQRNIWEALFFVACGVAICR